MAIIWSKKVAGALYEVRTAGATIRLYSNGVLHTEFNPKREITGSVWDLLFVPAAFLPADKVKRILLLGLGGGAVTHLYRKVWPEVQIDAIELNPVHIQVCRKFFGVDAQQTKMIEADAQKWLRGNRARYDIVIDDLFGHDGGEPSRAIQFDAEWQLNIKKSLQPHGLYIGNFADSQDVRQTSIRMKNSRLGFNFAMRFYNESCQNVIICASESALDQKLFRQNKQFMQEKYSAFRNLQYHHRRIK